MPVSTTSQPARASSTAIGRPIERMRPAPVTTATLPSSPVSARSAMAPVTVTSPRRRRRDRAMADDDKVRLEYDGADRRHHQRQPGEAQRVRRRDGRAPLGHPGRAAGAPRRARGDLAGRGQGVLVGARRRRHRRRPGRDDAPRADAPGPSWRAADLRPRRADHRRHPGVGDRRVVPAGAAVRHPHRGRGRALHASRRSPTA